MNKTQLDKTLGTIKNYIDSNTKPKRILEKSGTSGKTGFIAMAKMVITDAYVNRPIEFKFIQRGRQTPCTVSIEFSNASSTDPGLASLKYMGTDFGVFMHKTAASTWLLYVTKSEAYDAVTLIENNTAPQKVSITYPGTFIETKPTSTTDNPVTNATLGYTVGTAATCSGNAATATKLATARTLTIGSKGKTFDGSANVSWTLDEIGAAPKSHTHSYLPLSGGTLTGGLEMGANNITFTNTDTGDIVFNEGTAQVARLWQNNAGLMIASGNSTSNNGAGVINIPRNSNALTIGGNKIYHAGQKPTPADIGAAAASHGTHVSYGGNGSATTVSRSDHTHNYAGSSSAGGAANSSNVLNSNSRMEYGWNGLNYFNISGTAGNAAKANDTPTSAWWHVIRCNHANSAGFYTDIAVPFNAQSMYYKRISNGSVQDGGWVKVLDAKNYSSYNSFNGLEINTVAYDSTYTKAGIFSDNNVVRAMIKFGKAASSNDPGAIYLETSSTEADTNKGVLHLCPSDDSDATNDYVTIHGTNDAENIKLYTSGKATFASDLSASSIYATTFYGALNGNASTATSAGKLTTARNIVIGNKTNSFNGTGNITFTLADIGAAASSHTHDYITYRDTRADNETPDDVQHGLSIHLKTNGADGLSDGGGYHPSIHIKPWGDHSGGPYGELALTQNQNLWFRTSSSGTAWNAWKKVSLDGHTHNYAASSHNHTSLTGITSLTFAAESTDRASIGTTISSATTYMDFKLADDSGTDAWRWRFSPSGGSEFNAMYLSATSTTAAQLSVTGNIQGTTLTASGNSKTAKMGTGGGDVYFTNSASGKYLQLKDDGTIAYSDDRIITNSILSGSIPKPSSGSWFKGFVNVGGDGVTEIGKYLDFHNTNTSTADYDVRLTVANGGLSCSGGLSSDGNITMNNSGNAVIVKITGGAAYEGLKGGGDGICVGDNGTKLYLRHKTQINIENSSYTRKLANLTGSGGVDIGDTSCRLSLHSNDNPIFWNGSSGYDVVTMSGMDVDHNKIRYGSGLGGANGYITFSW